MNRLSKDNWMYTKKIAHRGLWNDEIPENSLTAYKRAAENNYAIEIDVYLTADGEVVVFHDRDLKRMTGDVRLVNCCTLKELKELSLKGTGEKIPTLQEVFDVCEGKAELLIELKTESTKSHRLEEATLKLLKNYKGVYAVQSFNPFAVKWFKNNAPEIIRGQLASFFIGEEMKAINKFVIKYMLLNRSNQIDFVSYDHRYLPNNICKKWKKWGWGPLIAWTVHNQDDVDRIDGYADNFIFEDFIPKT